MRARSVTPPLCALGFYAAVALGVAGCAAWDRFASSAAPVALAGAPALEASAHRLHQAAGVPESDARAVALHTTAAGVAARLGASTPADAVELEAALRAFEGAIEAVKASLPSPPAGSLSDADGGAPTEPTFPDPDPSMPSPTIPLPPPVEAVALVTR